MQLTCPSALCQGTLTSQCVQRNLNTIVLQATGTLQQSSRNCFLFVCLRRCFSLNLSNRNNNKNNGDQQKTRLEASKPRTVFTIALNGPATVNVINFQAVVKKKGLVSSSYSSAAEFPTAITNRLHKQSESPSAAANFQYNTN